MRSTLPLSPPGEVRVAGGDAVSGSQSNCIQEWYTPIKPAGRYLTLEVLVRKGSCEYVHFKVDTVGVVVLHIPKGSSASGGGGGRGLFLESALQGKE